MLHLPFIGWLLTALSDSGKILLLLAMPFRFHLRALSGPTYGWKSKGDTVDTQPRRMIAKLCDIHATNDNRLISHKANKCPFSVQTKVCTLSPTEPNMLDGIVYIGLEHWVNCNVKLDNIKMRHECAVGGWFTWKPGDRGREQCAEFNKISTEMGCLRMPR